MAINDLVSCAVVFKHDNEFEVVDSNYNPTPEDKEVPLHVRVSLIMEHPGATKYLVVVAQETSDQHPRTLQEAVSDLFLGSKNSYVDQPTLMNDLGTAGYDLVRAYLIGNQRTPVAGTGSTQPQSGCLGTDQMRVIGNKIGQGHKWTDPRGDSLSPAMIRVSREADSTTEYIK